MLVFDLLELLLYALACISSSEVGCKEWNNTTLFMSLNILVIF